MASCLLKADVTRIGRWPWTPSGEISQEIGILIKVRWTTMEPIKVLIVDHSSAMRDYLTELAEINGYHTRSLKQKREFLAELHHHDPDLLLLGPSNHSGQIRALSDVLEREKSGTPVLAIFDGAESGEAGYVQEGGNISYLHASFVPDSLKLTIEQLVRDSLNSDYKKLDRTIVGQTLPMVKLKKDIVRVAKADVTILISGESGTGKELVARAIHKISPRAEGPFIKVNSAALPTNLLESELFGFEKGAFTGAFNKKPGKFELAHSGTILLDEIGEIPLPMQAKLLQVLQDNEYSALGSVSNTKVDSRVLAATNNNLTEMVSAGSFRADLYYRLNVVSIHVPALRERMEDIDLLCDFFLKQYVQRYGREYVPLTDRIREQFCRYSWPGNVRELESMIQSMIVLGYKEGFYERMGVLGQPNTPASETKGLAPQTQEGTPPRKPKIPILRSLKKVCKKAVQKAESEAIMNVLFHTRWNRRKAATFLQISYKALLNKIKEYGIEDQYQAFVGKDDTDEYDKGLSV